MIKLFKDVGVIVLFIALVLVALSVHAAETPVAEVVQSIVRMDDSFVWSPLTLGMCIIGWLISLISDWGVKWNLMRTCLKDFLLDNTPRVIMGLLGVIACYVLIPEIIETFQLNMKMNNLGAFITGLSADVIVHRIRGLIPQAPSVREEERAKVRKRLDHGDAAADALQADKTRP